MVFVEIINHVNMLLTKSFVIGMVFLLKVEVKMILPWTLKTYAIA